MMKIAVLGSGMAGLGAVHRLKSEGLSTVLYEKRNYYGGHTASFSHDDGFCFDEGGHISFTKIERIQKLLAENVNHEYQTVHARVTNYWKGFWIKHPAQCNLHGLPVELVASVLRDYIDAKNNSHGEIRNYGEWLLATFGKTFAETFPMEYALKYHTTSTYNLTTDWLGPRLYTPSLEEVLRGALSPVTADVHYVTQFRYPTRGGFVSYLKPFVKNTQIRLSHELVGLDPKLRRLRFSNGLDASYDYVISSIPLPDLVPMISNVPADVLEASHKLATTTAVIVNIGIDRPDIFDAHWAYFYDRDFFITRLNTPHQESPNNVPPACSSIQAEVYYSKKYRPLDRTPEECVQPVINDLRRCGILREDDKILHVSASLVPHANVIFDLDRASALKTVHGYLDDVGILYCGRYGEWGHHWTDEAFISGENAAQKVLDSATSRVLKTAFTHGGT